MVNAGGRCLPDEYALLRAALPGYDVLGVLGRGAFAVVYLAEHRGLGREVAIKRLSQDLLPDADARHRFAAEARVLASLDHPHIVRVYDYVETEAVCALVMERVAGGTLAARMRVGLPTPATACAIALAVLNGLGHAHQHGVLHRDIKPENLRDNVRKFLKQLGATGRPVAVSFESGLWALIEDQLFLSGDSPEDVPVIVASAGLPELSGLSDTLPSFAAAWKVLRNRYAPNVVLGALFDIYGVDNLDLRRSVPLASALLSAARSQAWYFLRTAVNDVNFVSFELTFFSEEGSNPDPSQSYSPSEKAALLAWVRQFASVSRIPVVLESVPLGNTVMKTIDDKPYHWRDTWVQWLIGDSHFTHLRELRDAGVIGIVFGVAAGKDETCPCDAAHDGITNGGKRGIVSYSADDDGGYLAARLAALRGAGGLDLARENLIGPALSLGRPRRERRREPPRAGRSGPRAPGDCRRSSRAAPALA